MPLHLPMSRQLQLFTQPKQNLAIPFNTQQLSCQIEKGFSSLDF
jgi:hypothetical protein